MNPVTVYRTNTPESTRLRNTPEDFADVEYRQLVCRLDKDEESNTDRPTVTLFQGWWNESTKQPINNRQIFNKHFDSWSEAKDVFNAYIAQLANDGYKYALSPSPDGGYSQPLIDLLND